MFIINVSCLHFRVRYTVPYDREFEI
jgi:hypothetical protein